MNEGNIAQRFATGHVIFYVSLYCWIPCKSQFIFSSLLLNI